jgi:hypothetical protein
MIRQCKLVEIIDIDKKSTLKRFSRMFNTIIDAYELIDINMMDGKFTLSNNQTPPPLWRDWIGYL